MDDWTPETLAERRRDRALARRRRHRRRRAAAAAALLGVAAAIAAVVVTTTGGSTHHAPRPIVASAVRGPHRHHRTEAALRLGPATGHPGDARAAILMYHVIAPPPPGAPFPGLYVPRPEFAAQMHALRDAGYHAVTLDQLRANWRDGARLPARPIVITFDNGYHSQYADALPILHAMGWAADENVQLTGLPPSQGGITTAEIRGMLHDGWELDTQGMSHADLDTLDAAELHAQVDDARSILRRRYRVGVSWFCYPSGHYDPTVVAAVRAAGFVGSTTVVPGWASRVEDPFRLPRLRVLGGTTAAELLGQIAAARTAAPPPDSYGVTA